VRGHREHLPPDTTGPRPIADDPDVRRDLSSWVAAHDEAELRAMVEDVADRVMAGSPAAPRNSHPIPTLPQTPTWGRRWTIRRRWPGCGPRL